MTACRAASQPVALLWLDVDFFKRYNDRYGHPAGDVCLQRIASALAAQAALHDGVTARIGGEEFALLLPGRDERQALEVAQAVCSAVQDLSIPHLDSEVASVTVSIGVAAGWGSVVATPEALVLASDRALYEAKARGRNRFALADPQQPAIAATGKSEIEPVAALSDREMERIERLRGLLSQGFRGLRFPRDLEAGFGERGGTLRRLWLFFLGVGGALFVTVYVGFSQPMFPDLDPEPLRQMLWLDAVVLAPVILCMLLPLPGWLRETLFAALASVVGVSLALWVSQSTAITRYSYALSLFLVPMFCAVIAAQPFRFSLVASLVVWGTTAACLHTSEPVAREIWWNSTFTLFAATLYTLVAGYLLEWGNRRQYLLTAVAQAQSLVLARDTAELRRLATTDSLTQLPNRRSFEVAFEHARSACAAASLPLALLLIDVDHFKLFNDTYGHPVGDGCLQSLGQLLLRWLAETRQSPPLEVQDTPMRPQLARLGGEEFGVLLPALDCTGALQVAHALCARVRALGIAHRSSIVAATVTVSIGVASVHPKTSGVARELLSRADAALYRAKSQGRDRACT